MEREKILIETEEEFFCIAYGDHKDFERMEDEKGYFDSEKGMVEIDFIVKRLSDGKFFSGSYWRGTAGSDWIDDLELEEVFEKKKMVISYE